MKRREHTEQPSALELPKPGLSEDQLAILKQQARFCRTMGHPIRLFLLHYIYEHGGEAGSSRLAEVSGLSSAALSQHVSKMVAAGLVETRREGKFVHVRIAREEIGQACELVRRALQKHVQEGALRFEP